MKTQPAIFLRCFLTAIFLILLDLQLYRAASIDSITLSRPLYPNETLISTGHIFELGFFRPNGSLLDQYAGIWYTNITPVKVLWVANRNAPLPYSDRSASLAIGSDGNLGILDGQGDRIWGTNVSSSSGDSFAVLLDNGNLVLKDASSGSDLWESFGDPTDTLLETTKMGINVATGKKQYLTSWKSEADPSPGYFVTGITSENPPQVFTWINGSIPYWRSGLWDGSVCIGAILPMKQRTYTGQFAVDQDIEQGTTYLTFNGNNNFVFGYMDISSTGSLRFMLMRNRNDGWEVNWEAPINLCEVYGTCGPFGVCDALGSPICSCLEGFSPNSAEEWSRGNWSRGCTRMTELNCERNRSILTASAENKDVFLKMSRMKIPDSSIYLETIYNARDCSSWCLNNCSCLAYSFMNTIGCLTWTNELMDILQFNESGEDLFLRLAYITSDEDSTRKQKLIISLSVAFGVISLGGGIAVWAHCTRRTKLIKMFGLFSKLVKLRDPAVPNTSSDINSWKEKLKIDDGQELPVFNFDSILTATDNFSSENKLGKGGFGSVYKGKLQDGRNIAVKRLASNSGQGAEEFKTEIILISRLQHRNLVRLIGCCIEEEEKILIYEYLANKSLDTFIFDPIKKMELNWDKRFEIIKGIARGLLYLHRDSYLRVIHRDLKTSNILLDENLNPKISDFGLARMFQDTRVLENTRRIVGTLGYMAPEYAMTGNFSEKSDIYSFGVLLLEIVSSKKNTSFYYDEQHINLLSYTWRLRKEGRLLELLDEELLESSSPVEVEKCIQVGLMCVQDRAADRPNMSSVIQMLAGELSVSEPKEPAYSIDHATPSYQERLRSTNILTNSLVEGR